MHGSNANRSSALRRLAALALAWPCACFAIGFAPADAGEPRAVSPAGAFDSVFERIVGPVSLDATTAAYEQDLDRLQRLLPPGDRAREVRFRSVFCGSI